VLRGPRRARGGGAARAGGGGGGRRRGVLAGECQPEVGRTGPGASRPDPGPRSIPIRSGRSARTSH